jgi:leader peptidase (prepilin peptidase) / N-methyltransferase
VILVILSGIAGVVAGVALRRFVVAQTGAPAPALLLGLATGSLAALAAWRFGTVWELPAYLYFAAVSVPLAIIDLRTLRLPNVLTLSSYPIVAGLLLLPAGLADGWPDYLRAALAGAAVLALFVVLHLVNPSGMGLGDVKLAGPMGALLGWVSWQAVMVGVVVGFALAAVVGIAMILARRADRRSALPFGPFMLAGAWFAILTEMASAVVA